MAPRGTYGPSLRQHMVMLWKGQPAGHSEGKDESSHFVPVKGLDASRRRRLPRGASRCSEGSLAPRLAEHGRVMKVKIRGPERRVAFRPHHPLPVTFSPPGGPPRGVRNDRKGVGFSDHGEGGVAKGGRSVAGTIPQTWCET
jgi:hypothetical protein